MAETIAAMHLGGADEIYLPGGPTETLPTAYVTPKSLRVRRYRD